MNKTNANRPKVLYLYAGQRKEFYKNWLAGKNPDTQLLGLNHMKELDIDAEFREWRLAEWLRKINFNLVHLPYIFIIQKYDVVFICAGLPLVFLAKYILHLKRPKFVIYNTYLTNALKRNPKGISGFITKKAIENIDVIVCTSKIQKNFLLENGFDQNKIVFIPIGIDASRFANYSLPATHYPTDYILSVGRDPGRDYRTLFEAVKNLPIRVVVATKKEAITGLTIPQNVEIKLNVPYAEMPSLYQNSLFAVTPLYKNEGSAGSDTSGQYGYLEPMAAGKAVITADKPTVKDYVSHQVDGLLYRPEDPVDLRNKIELLVANDDLRTELGQLAKVKVLTNFTSKQFATGLASIFKKLIF